MRNLEMRIWLILASFLVFLPIPSCGRPKEEGEVSGFHAPASSTPAVVNEEYGEQSAPPLLPSSTPQPSEGAAPSTATFRNSVLIGGDLGLTVTGEGVNDPHRVPAALEHELFTFLPQLRDMYDQQLTHEPRGMGSLDVQMTIEPSGKVSDLRFPLQRVSSAQLTSAVYDVMRAWQFTPAEHRVDLRYRMIFVPAGIDPVSIGIWEHRLADRTEVDRPENRPAIRTSPKNTLSDKSLPRTDAAVARKSEGHGDPQRRETSTVGEAVEKPGQAAPETPSPRVADPRPESSPRQLAQWYQVTRPTQLYATPHSSAPVVARLHTGRRIWVIGTVGGEWLEVRSVRGRRSGFLFQEDAKPEQRERVRR